MEKQIKNKQISYVCSEQQRGRVQRLANKHDFDSVTHFFDTLVDDFEREHEYSIYREYKEVVNLIANKIEMYGHVTSYSQKEETEEEAEMYNLLDTAYTLLVKADAMLNDKENYVLIDETHPLFEGKIHEQYKHALSSVNLDFIKKIAEK